MNRSVNARGKNQRLPMITEPALKSSAPIPLPPLGEEVVADLAAVFRLLSDETRLRILIYLAQHGELHVRALCDRLEQSQPAVSHHLALLREAELIEPRREGKHNFYRLLPGRVQALLDTVFHAVPEDDRRIRFDDYLLSYSPDGHA